MATITINDNAYERIFNKNGKDIYRISFGYKTVWDKMHYDAPYYVSKFGHSLNQWEYIKILPTGYEHNDFAEISIIAEGMNLEYWHSYDESYLWTPDDDMCYICNSTIQRNWEPHNPEWMTYRTTGGHPLCLRAKVTDPSTASFKIHVMSGNVRITGNISALVDYEKYPLDVDVPANMFQLAFADSRIYSVPDIVCRTANEYSFDRYAKGSSITFFKVHSVHTKSHAFDRTFEECNSLTEVDTDYFRPYHMTGDKALYRTFYNCTGIKKIELNYLHHVDNPTEMCICAMFEGCTVLTEATIRTYYSYAPNFTDMFKGCSSLNYVYSSARRETLNYSNWLSGVASTGVFKTARPASFDSMERSADTIPVGWTIEEW